MPGTTPLTSQLALLISTTTTKVEIGSNAVRLRLRSLTWATGQPPSVRVDDEGAMTSAVRPIASLGQHFTPSPTARRAQACSGVRAQSARKDAGVDRSRPCVAWFCA